ncbi:MAG: hypothetical protein ACRDFX_02650 [Chloroflexota bacterium]
MILLIRKVQSPAMAGHHPTWVVDLGARCRTAITREARLSRSGHDLELAVGKSLEDLIACVVGNVQTSPRPDSERTGALGLGLGRCH